MITLFGCATFFTFVSFLLFPSEVHFVSVVEQKYFTCPNRESNPGRWIYRQTLYHVAVKAGIYSKAVEVFYLPRPCDIHPRQFIERS